MVDFQGKASACCQFEKSVPLREYNSMIEPYRQAMINGEKIAPCRRCWNDEEQGFPSLRESALKDFQRYPIHNGLMILDLRLTNKCNLACTMCSEHASSLWAKIKSINDNFILTQEIQDELIRNCNDLVKISIQGGEPFYGNEFIDFVNRLPNKENIQLEIFSNTFTADIDVVKQWVTQFKQVMFISSVDGIEEVFEDIRWPAQWKKFKRKVLELYQIPKLGFCFNFTLQNLNILNLKRFINWRNQNVPNCGIIISILEYPKHFRYDVLQKDEIEQALEMLKSINNANTSEFRIISTVIDKLEHATVNEQMLQEKEKQLRFIKKLRTNHMNKN